ncbi:MAG TPA: hypothetical protein VGX28_15170 [Frankiaceae bacterium]|jgi:hypothetical protein|nr:hypothetical protein [Frankiaceae bacterium]
MRLVPTLLASAALVAAGFAGAANAAVAERCPDGYVGVVVDDHDVCTNGISYCPSGYTGIGVAGRNVCVGAIKIQH